MQIQCSNCGAMNNKSANYCSNCYKKLERGKKKKDKKEKTETPLQTKEGDAPAKITFSAFADIDNQDKENDDVAKKTKSIDENFEGEIFIEQSGFSSFVSEKPETTKKIITNENKIVVEENIEPKDKDNETITLRPVAIESHVEKNDENKVVSNNNVIVKPKVKVKPKIKGGVETTEELKTKITEIKKSDNEELNISDVVSENTGNSSIDINTNNVPVVDKNVISEKIPSKSTIVSEESSNTEIKKETIKTDVTASTVGKISVEKDKVIVDTSSQNVSKKNSEETIVVQKTDNTTKTSHTEKKDVAETKNTAAKPLTSLGLSSLSQKKSFVKTSGLLEEEHSRYYLEDNIVIGSTIEGFKTTVNVTPNNNSYKAITGAVITKENSGKKVNYLKQISYDGYYDDMLPVDFNNEDVSGFGLTISDKVKKVIPIIAIALVAIIISVLVLIYG